MSDIEKYREMQIEQSRHLRREMAKVRDKMHYIADATKEAQETIAHIHKEGTCTAVDALLHANLYIKIAESQGMPPELVAALQESQQLHLELQKRLEIRGSGQLGQVIDKLQLSEQSPLDRLERWLNDYFE